MSFYFIFAVYQEAFPWRCKGSLLYTPLYSISQTMLQNTKIAWL